MYDTSEIRKNLKIQIDGVPFTVVDFQFVKPGKGQPFTRCRLRNMMTGSQLERTWKSGEKLERAALEEKQMQFLYLQDGFYTFMDTTNYDQLQISKEQMGENALYLMDGTMVDVLLFNELPIGVTPPTFVEMKVTQTDPGFKGHIGQHHEAGNDGERLGRQRSALRQRRRVAQDRHPHRRIRRARQGRPLGVAACDCELLRHR